ncbi:hypothetical protein FRC03_000724 [Tulasnella sp. 419]|nr:hypothetical protein FRC03_000724 [Tulasnella sp. 419]
MLKVYRSLQINELNRQSRAAEIIVFELRKRPGGAFWDVSRCSFSPHSPDHSFGGTSPTSFAPGILISPRFLFILTNPRYLLQDKFQRAFTAKLITTSEH